MWFEIIFYVIIIYMDKVSKNTQAIKANRKYLNAIVKNRVNANEEDIITNNENIIKLFNYIQKLVESRINPNESDIIELQEEIKRLKKNK